MGSVRTPVVWMVPVNPCPEIEPKMLGAVTLVIPSVFSSCRSPSGPVGGGPRRNVSVGVGVGAGGQGLDALGLDDAGRQVVARADAGQLVQRQADARGGAVRHGGAAGAGHLEEGRRLAADRLED